MDETGRDKVAASLGGTNQRAIRRDQSRFTLKDHTSTRGRDRPHVTLSTTPAELVDTLRLTW